MPIPHKATWILTFHLLCWMAKIPLKHFASLTSPFSLAQGPLQCLCVPAAAVAGRWSFPPHQCLFTITSWATTEAEFLHSSSHTHLELDFHQDFQSRRAKNLIQSRRGEVSHHGSCVEWWRLLVLLRGCPEDDAPNPQEPRTGTTKKCTTGIRTPCTRHFFLK